MPNPEAKAYFEQGENYQKTGNIEAAIEAYTKAIELDNKCIEAYSNRGNLYKNLGLWEKSLGDYDEIIAIRPNNATAYYNRGNLYREQGLLDQALKDYDQAIELQPDNAAAYGNRGVLYAEQRQEDKALLDYNQAIELGNVESYNNRGNLYRKHGQWHEALKDYHKAIELNRDYADAYGNRGNLYQKQGQEDKALEDYNQAIELGNVTAYNNRGVLYKKQGQTDKALKDYDQAIELQPDYADAYGNRGVLYAEQGQTDKALLDYNKAIELGNVAAYYNRGLLYTERGQWEQALEDYHKAIELNRDYADAYGNRGALYAEQGQEDQALLDFNQAIELDKTNAVAYMNRSMLYAQQGKYELALADNRKVNQLMPGFPFIDQQAREYQEKLVKQQDFQPRKIQKLELNRLYALPQLAMEFGQLNLFLGKNGAGKTTLLKVLHCIASDNPKQNLQQHFALSVIEQANIQAFLQSYQQQWQWNSTTNQSHRGTTLFEPVFIPDKCLLSLYRAIITLPHEYSAIDSQTCQKLLRNSPDKQLSNRQQNLLECFEQHYKGSESVERNRKSSPRNEFSYKLASGETIPLEQGAEGIKKLQLLRLLLENHSITRESVLLIDEAEANLHPAFVRQFVQILAALAAKGVQIFIASHSSFVLEELVIASKRNQQSAFCFALTKQGYICNDLKDGVPDNEILAEALEMHDHYDEVMWHD